MVADGFHYLYHPVMHRLRGPLASGELGDLVRVEANVFMPDPAPLRYLFGKRDELLGRLGQCPGPGLD